MIQIGFYAGSIFLKLFENDLRIEDIHLVGHSLGGQMCGAIGRSIIAQSQGKYVLPRWSQLLLKIGNLMNNYQLFIEFQVWKIFRNSLTRGLQTFEFQLWIQQVLDFMTTKLWGFLSFSHSYQIQTLSLWTSFIPILNLQVGYKI